MPGKNFYDILGLKSGSSDVVEKLLKVIHPDDAKIFKSALKNAIFRNKEYDIEFRIILPDKSSIASFRGSIRPPSWTPKLHLHQFYPFFPFWKSINSN